MSDLKPVPQVGVGAVVFKEGKVLLTQRSKPPAAGSWAIPGGKLELGETLQEAAERELREETGITIRAKDPVFIFDMIDRDDSGRVRFHYVIVDLAADYVSGELIAGDDASDARWVSPHELQQLSVSEKTIGLLHEVYQFI